MIESVGIIDSYKDYKKSADNPTDVKTYGYIINDWMKFLMNKVFEGYDVKLGAKLGSISIRGRKAVPRIDYKGEIKGVAPNWGKTKKYWNENPEAKANKTLVYCFNEHSNGLIYNLIWRKKGIIVTNKTYYSLRFSRANKRTLNKLAHQGKEYMESKPR